MTDYAAWLEWVAGKCISVFVMTPWFCFPHVWYRCWLFWQRPHSLSGERHLCAQQEASGVSKCPEIGGTGNDKNLCQMSVGFNITLSSSVCLQLTVYNYHGGPCYRCLYPVPPPPETVTNCSDGGVLGVGESWPLISSEAFIFMKMCQNSPLFLKYQG